MISKRSLLFILCFAITGCNMDCVEPGLQSRNTSVNVDIPVHKADKIHWVDSGQVISKGEEIKFTLDGSVNFCPSKEGENPRKVVVPAVFCADGSIPNYSSKLINNSGLDEQEVCKNVGFGNSQSYSKRRYVDTGIKVNPGDKLSFSLISREMMIDYDNPQGKGISFDDNCYKAVENDRKETIYKKATVSEVHQGGEFFCDGKDGTKNKIQFLPLDKTKAKESKVLVGNGYTPYDNKVHFNQYHIKNNKSWMDGSLLDLRRAKIGLNELCDGKNCDFNEVKKYSSYELNCYYQNICYTKEGISRPGSCVSSIRYKKYDKGNRCDMYSHLKEVEDKLKQINVDFTSNTEEDISWAEALVAKIGGSDNKDGGANGTQCLPKEKGAGENDKREGYDYVRKCSKTSDDFEDFSLRLNHDYEVNQGIKSGSDVMLAIASNGEYYLHRGGYHVKVTRSCQYINGEKLYMYLGDEPPKDLHGVGTNDFKVVGVRERVNGKDEYTILDVISGKHFQDGESKKIYFGIDVSNVEKDDITDKDGKYYENNKYTVNLFLKRKINDFISSNINKIFDFITAGGGDTVKDLYEGYRKGLFQGVRALLTLYVIFTVVGYMLGTIQLSKFDFIVRMFKIAFIAFAFSDRSWELFGTTLSKLFVGGSIYLVDSFSGYVGEGGRKFAFLDLTVGVLFTAETWLKFLSLMLSGPFGFIAFLTILYATFMFLQCIISATFKYVISTVLVAFLLSLTPLFIVFILFQQTKPLFHNWIKTLAHVAVQPVILFSSLSLLNQLMYSVLYNLTNFSACYQCLISVNFLSYDLCLMKSILPLGYSPGTNVDVALSTGERAGGHFAALPIDLIQAFIYLIIAGAMETFVSISEAMAQALFSSGFGVVQGVSKVAESASQAILSTVGLDDQTQGNRERRVPGMIPLVKGMVSKDRTKVDVKDNSMSSKSKIPEQSGQQTNPDKTIRSDPSAKAKNKEENGEE